MKSYKEWSHLKQKEDKKNPFSSLYQYEDESEFYIEPIFYSYFQSLILHYPDKVQEILKTMEEIVKKNRLVIFTGMDEEVDTEPLTKKENAILITIYDIADRLNLYIENKSRGSDYGD